MYQFAYLFFQLILQYTYPYFMKSPGHKIENKIEHSVSNTLDPIQRINAKTDSSLQVTNILHISKSFASGHGLLRKGHAL